MFQKLSVVDASKGVSVQLRVNISLLFQNYPEIVLFVGGMVFHKHIMLCFEDEFCQMRNMELISSDIFKAGLIKVFKLPDRLAKEQEKFTYV